MADPEPPDESEIPPHVPVWPGLPSFRTDYFIRLNALQACLEHLLDAGWAKTGTPEWYLQNALFEVHMNVTVLFSLIANMLDVGFGAYDWKTWAEDTEPESGKAAADLAASVGVGLDRLLGKWR